jgi:copper chaperone CopZ
MYKTILMSLVLAFSTLNTADACPMADAAAFQEAAAKVAATEGAHASFMLNGMTCGSCSSKVTKHIDAVEGVLASAVDYQTGKVEIAFDSSKTDAAKLEAELVSTGYTLQKES